jgi:hypothetical protein
VQRIYNAWNLPWSQRGLVIEDWLGRNLPRNFPGIDRFVNGMATSIKSLDLTAPTYQNLGALASKVQGYINALANFQGARLITPHMITGRELLLAVPTGSGTPAQWGILRALQQAATNLDVILNVIRVP